MRNHDHHGEGAGAEGKCCYGDVEEHHGYLKGNRHVPVAFTGFIGVPCV